MAPRSSGYPSKKHEIMKEIPVTNGRYSASSLGRIYNNQLHFYCSTLIRKGYVCVYILGRYYGVHQLVANAFLRHDLNGDLEVNHIDGNKQNNNLTNLEVVSHRRNMQHAWENGLIKPSNISKAKRRQALEGDSLLLEKFIDDNNITRTEFSRRTGVSPIVFSRRPLRLTRKTIDKISKVYPSFPVEKHTKSYSMRVKDYSLRTADEWFEKGKWTGFLMTLPLNKTRTYECKKIGSLVSIRSTASILSNNVNCDRVFKVSIDFDKHTVTITPNKKKQESL